MHDATHGVSNGERDCLTTALIQAKKKIACFINSSNSNTQLLALGLGAFKTKQ